MIISAPSVLSTATYISEIASSIWPSRCNSVNSSTPSAEPASPPSIMMMPILKSTAPRRQYPMTPDSEAPTSWFADDATATPAGTPIKISIGVNRKPPPRPNTPVTMPTPAPRPNKAKTLSDSSAIGR